MRGQLLSVCPGCRQLIHPGAEICPKCRAELWYGVEGDPEIVEAQARIDEMIAQADEPTLAREVKKPAFYKRPVLVGLMALTAASIVMAALGWTVYRREHFWVVTVGVFASVAFGAGLLYTATYKPLWKETLVRPTGEAAVLAYFEAILHKQWGAAHRVLAPFARAREARLPQVAPLGLEGGAESFRAPEGLERYWRRLSEGGFGRHNHVLGVSVLPGTPTGSVEAHRVVLDIDPRVQLAGFALVDGVNIVGLTFDCIAVKHHSQYWVLTGEVCSSVDRRIATRLRA